ncbi:GNAT family N-acetyltransferase [Snuella sedimenti]|uniref:GNAT family N-acetyltransferase n=1 Tax=Snuella sedimenti TaxID=2798802 RepID=A0A8J7J2S9_9FLAO|nr:GNAT family protein [Snuella sedimenti]MBJ6367223.1 GNAT family N-acetyltransferase [Snuella sedimenti]
MKDWFDNIQLEGNKVLLEPLDMSHKNALLRAASDGKLWELWFTSVPSEETIDSYIENALIEKLNGKGYPFVVVEKSTGTIIGSTRYCNATPEHRRLEIGYTWYAKTYQRTGINTECKYLLLKHAFEKLRCIAVEFRTHWHNVRSRAAIARLGAKQDGVLRNHKLSADGSYRDTVVFSITDQEWKAVEIALKYEIRRYKDKR